MPKTSSKVSKKSPKKTDSKIQIRIKKPKIKFKTSSKGSKKNSQQKDQKTQIKIKKPQINVKKPNVKFKKPSWEEIKNSKVTKYSLYVLVVLAFFVLIDLGVQYLNNDYSAAVVNGDRITNSDYYYRLDQSYGSSVVSQLIQEELIFQEARKQGVVATEEEINADLAEITDQVGGEEQLQLSLDAYNISMEDLKRQIELDILSRKMLEPTLEYTEEDVKTFFNDYSDVLFPDETAALEDGELLDYETHKEDTKNAYIQQEVSNAMSSWLATLEAEASIQNNVVDKPGYKFLGATRNILTNIIDEANTNEADSTETE